MSAFTGTPALTRAALRREWLRLGLWVIGLALLMTITAATVRDLVGTDEGTRSFVRLYVMNPVLRMFGLASGATIGAFILTRVYILIGVLITLMSIFTVVRNTRANEDMGRTELIGSLAVGRHASLAAALILAVGANLVLTMLIAAALILNGLAPIGAFTAGASLGGLGIAFAGIAAVTAQIAPNARKANGYAAAIMGAMALLSSIGNMLGTIDEAALRVTPAWPAWLTPFGWGQLMRPYDTNNAWFLIAFLLFFLVLVAVSILLESKRDIGQGLLAQRPGPATASRALKSPTGLAWHQQRGLLLGWALALTAIAAVYGVVSTEIETLIEDMEQARELFEQIGGSDAILDGYLSATLGIVGLLTAVYAIQALLRTRHEEIHGPLESLLGTATSRTRWLNAHGLIAALGSSIILLAAGITMGITTGIVLHDLQRWTLEMTLAALTHLPAVLLFAAISGLAYGATPRRATLIVWAALLIGLLTGPMFGPMLDLPTWAMDLSPFTHVAGPPADDIDYPTLAILLAIAAVLWILALGLLRRRDLDVH